jgi:hypothetical protein
MPQAIHIDSSTSSVLRSFSVEPGESLQQVFDRLGMSPHIEYVPGPTSLQEAAKRAQEVGAEVSGLLRECRTWNDVPSPEWDHGPGECVTCDARRIVEEMLD